MGYFVNTLLRKYGRSVTRARELAPTRSFLSPVVSLGILGWVCYYYCIINKLLLSHTS